MIQRYLYTALADGIAAIDRDSSLLDFIFIDRYGLSAEETGTIKRYWAEKPPKVAHGYPLATQTVPLWAIVLGSEQEKTKFIGDDGDVVMDPDDSDYLCDVKSAIWAHNYRILVYADHPDVALYYYEVVKSIILLASDYFVEQGLFEQHLTGHDLIPNPKYLPEHLFVRELGFSCEQELRQIDRDSRLRKAFKVSGIHVDNLEGTGDVSGVKTGITTYTE